MDLASEETKMSSGYERKYPDKNVLPANHTGNQSYCKSQDLITNGNHTGNEANCISCDLIAKGNHTGKEDNYASLDVIANGNQTGNEAYWMPPELITSGDYIRNRSKNEKAANESIKGHQSMVVCLEQFKEWPALRIEFSPADCYDASNSQMLSALPSINPNEDLYDDTVRCHNTSSGIGENRVDNGDHMPVTPANPVLKDSLESSGRTILNYKKTQDEAVCPKDLLDARYDGFDFHKNLTLSFKDPLKDGTIVKDVGVKIRKGEIAVNKSVMCPVRSNKRDPVSVDTCVQIVLSFSSLKCVIFPSNEKKEKDLKVYSYKSCKYRFFLSILKQSCSLLNNTMV